MKRLLLYAILNIVFSAVVSGAADSPVLNPASSSITDSAISADIATIKALQKRLADLNGQGMQLGSYHIAKAQAWLDMAMDEYVMNDRTRIVEDALIQADQIIVRLETKQSNLGMDTLILPTSKLIRPDLWRQAAALKKSPGFACGEDLVARLEVQLVWAGHEENQLGWRNAKPYILAAERLAGEAGRKIEKCPASQPSAAVSADKADCPANQEQKSSGVLEPVPDRVHFAVNSDLLGSRSAAVLERLAAVLRNYPDVSVELQGNADERGSEAFNHTLSRNRAEVVRAYLVAAGIAQERITLKAFGGTQPLTSGKDSGSYARNRRVVFVFFTGDNQLRPFAQFEDLRIEENGRPADK